MTTDDSPTVTNEDERALRMFCGARDCGDAQEMKRWWAVLVENNVDRVRGIAATSGPRELRREEREDAVQAAFIRLWDRMVHTFRGTTTAEFYAAVRTCVGFALAEEHRRGAKNLGRERSVDAARQGDDDSLGGYDVWTAAESLERFEREAHKGAAADFLDWALPAVKDNHRLVLERTLDKVPVPDIAAELGTSENNIHQMRRRGLQELAKLWNDYEDHNDA